MALTRPRAAQIYNLDYKQATRVVTVTNITLSGGAPAQVDGVNLATNDRILVTGQSIASQNGIYDVVTVGSGSNGTWSRTNDANSTGEIDAGMIVMVTEGTIYADTQWKLITDNPITIGVTALTFTQNYSANSISGGTSNVTVYSNANVTISSAGTPNVLVISSTGTVTSGTATSGTASVTGNITGGNILTSGLLTVTGNIYTGNILTNGYYYANGVQFAGGGAGGTPGGANTYVQFNDNGIFNGTAGFTFNKTTNAISTTGAVSATGNITGGNFLTGGAISATGNITGSNVNASGDISATGNISGLNLNSTHADLAEMYCADADYAPGTVVEFGGNTEVTITTESHSTRVAGIVSTNPSYLMNSTLNCENPIAIALTGRVPCQVVGTIYKGDRLVSSGLYPGVATGLDLQQYQPGCIIGKAMANYQSTEVGVIEVAVGRF